MSILAYAQNGNINEIIKLVNDGVSVDKSGCYGTTPLMEASYYGHFDIVKYLVEHNCLINNTNDHDITALMEASRNGHFKIVKYLIRNNADVTEALIGASIHGHFEIVKYLVKHGALIKEKSWNKVTALIFAYKQKYYDIISYLNNITFKRLHLI